jgi:hypothetical protein
MLPLWVTELVFIVFCLQSRGCILSEENKMTSSFTAAIAQAATPEVGNYFYFGARWGYLEKITAGRRASQEKFRT